CELCLRRIRVHIGRTLTIVQEPSAYLVIACMQVRVDVEVMLVQVAGRCRLECSDRNCHSIYHLRRGVRGRRCGELTEDVAHLLVCGKRIQYRQPVRGWRKLLY